MWIRPASGAGVVFTSVDEAARRIRSYSRLGGAGWQPEDLIPFLYISGGYAIYGCSRAGTFAGGSQDGPRALKVSWEESAEELYELSTRVSGTPSAESA